MLYFVTTNKNKIVGAHTYLDLKGITFEPINIELSEIQSLKIEPVAEHKAKDAFQQIKKPLIVKDDGWMIPSLNGFPGAYMKYINEWFTVEDLFSLMQHKTNREIIFHEVVCYIDNRTLKTFSGELKGIILDEPKGSGVLSTRISSFRKDLKSMAECDSQKIAVSEKRDVWNNFAKWYLTYSGKTTR